PHYLKEFTMKLVPFFFAFFFMDQNLTSLPWFQGDIQHNVTARPFEEQRIRPDIADRVDRQSLLNVIRRG
ncbi:hypothetical protein Q8G81_30300, partial [Klebsiella pneumoniae]